AQRWRNVDTADVGFAFADGSVVPAEVPSAEADPTTDPTRVNSQSFTVRSSELVARRLPSREIAIRRIAPSCAKRASSRALVPSTAGGLICQKRTRLSAPPASRRCPSGVNRSASWSLVASGRVSRRLPVATSHSLIVRSALALARTLPSLRNAREKT